MLDQAKEFVSSKLDVRGNFKDKTPMLTDLVPEGYGDWEKAVEHHLYKRMLAVEVERKLKPRRNRGLIVTIETKFTDHPATVQETADLLETFREDAAKQTRNMLKELPQVNKAQMGAPEDERPVPKFRRQKMFVFFNAALKEAISFSEPD